jgi:hypothetical protein
MDFLAKFDLSILPAKQQVLHAASGHTFTKASTSSFVSPWSPKTAVAGLPPQVQNCLRNFRRSCVPAPPLPSRSTASYITSSQIAPPPRVRLPSAAGPGKAPHRPRRIPRLVESRYYPPLKFALGVPAASGSQEGWVMAPLQRLPPPKRRHNTRQVPPAQHAVCQ